MVIFYKYLVVMELVSQGTHEAVEYLLHQHFESIRISLEGVMLSAVIEVDGWRSTDTDVMEGIFRMGFIRYWRPRLIEP